MSMMATASQGQIIERDFVRASVLPGGALSEDTTLLLKGIQDTYRKSGRDDYRWKRGAELAAELFDATAEAKIAISRVAMYLDETWRKRIFKRLDEIHDIESWEPGALPLVKDSFLAFLQTMFLLRPEAPPALGLSVSGQLLAAWVRGGDRLILRFLDRNRVRVVFNRGEGDTAETGTFEMPLDNLPARIAAIGGPAWLGK
ncbi:MAG: hypothetical protein ING19_02730 [Azospirillum sp.]|nr:hypothetical protein [Azospirillum sp.]